MSTAQKAFVFPGVFQLVKNYGNYDGLDIWLKSSFGKDIVSAQFYIGHSGGVNFILSRYDAIKEGKFIFVNSLVRKRNSLILFWDWIRFLLGEGIAWNKLTPISNWPYGLGRVLELLNVDNLAIIQKIPRENMVVIRGKGGNYICDKKSTEILKNNGIKLIEVDAGHDWNENIARAVEACIEGR